MLTAPALRVTRLTPAQLLAVRAVAHGATYAAGAEQLGITAETFRSRLHKASVALEVAPKSAHLVYVCCQQGMLELPGPIPPLPSPGLNGPDARTLGLIALGHNYASAARVLRVHSSAVQHRLRRAYQVLGARNQPHAVYLGVGTGNVPLNLNGAHLMTGGR